MGIEFGGNSDHHRVGDRTIHARVLAEEELGKAADELSDTIYRIAKAEKLYRESGLRVEEEVLRKMVVKLKNIGNELIKAMTL